MSQGDSRIRIERRPPLVVITITRSARRNAVDGPTALALAEAFRAFEADDALRVALLVGEGGNFCAGADLAAIAQGDVETRHRIDPSGDGPMGPTRMVMTKPTIAVVSGYCVAGGLELALWCDMRIADTTAVFGVFCRRFGVPLIDGGTVRLPRIVGMGRALDMILTGRAVAGDEALTMGLVSRVVPMEDLMREAEATALAIAAFPQACLRNDRASACAQWDLPEPEAIAREFAYGVETLRSGETFEGAARFTAGEGRGGRFTT